MIKIIPLVLLGFLAVNAAWGPNGTRSRANDTVSVDTSKTEEVFFLQNGYLVSIGNKYHFAFGGGIGWSRAKSHNYWYPIFHIALENDNYIHELSGDVIVLSSISDSIDEGSGHIGGGYAFLFKMLEGNIAVGPIVGFLIQSHGSNSFYYDHGRYMIGSIFTNYTSMYWGGYKFNFSLGNDHMRCRFIFRELFGAVVDDTESNNDGIFSSTIGLGLELGIKF